MIKLFHILYYRPPEHGEIGPQPVHDQIATATKKGATRVAKDTARERGYRLVYVRTEQEG